MVRQSTKYIITKIFQKYIIFNNFFIVNAKAFNLENWKVKILERSLNNKKEVQSTKLSQD